MFGSRYLALQLNHAPLQVEQRYMEMYPASQFWDQRIMNAMSTFCEPPLRNPLSACLQELQGRGPGVEKSLRVCHILCQRESSFCKGRVLNVRTSVCLNFRGRGDS